MREGRRAGLIASAVLLASLLASLGACAADSEPAPRTPDLGGPTAMPSAVPSEPMDHLESSVAERLRPELTDDALTLEHVACPTWNGAVPAHLRCQGYVDGVVGAVEVDLAAGTEEGVEFDAELVDGVVATSRLVDRLQQEGYRGVRCGEAVAYPARPGLRIVCQVHDQGETAHVVATVTDRSGAVRIEDY